VITLKHFKAIVIGIGSLFFLAVIFAGVLFFQNQRALSQNKGLQKRLANSEKQIEQLRHEKEILMARLVRAEAKTKENVAGESQIPRKAEIAQPKAPAPQVASKPKPIKAVQKKSSVPQAAPTETQEAEPVISVAVENFKVSRESDNRNLSAQFKVKNTSTAPQKVTGRVVVVLKGDDLQVDQWLAMPAVGLAGGKPSGKKGKSFSIQRFYTMNLTSKAPDHSDQFQTAAIYVFTKTGELLLEQDFSVNLPPVPVGSARKPFTQTASEETPSTGQPSSETSENGEATNSLNNMPSVF
jgi:hypothetical protein